jgi:oligoribonuclease NrnB/cAMP/cGMP phosphodiesterase (DHH superfamily)
MKPLIIYHANCADGFGAAFAAWLTLGDDAEYLPAKYGEEKWDTYNFTGRDIYILDFSFPRSVMNMLFKHAKKVVWLDHHKTAFEMWCPGELNMWMSDPIESRHIMLDNNKSGALLAWEYFHPGTEVPTLIKHIDDYDRWQFKLEGTKEFNKALWSYTPWSFEKWRETLISDHTGYPMLKAEGAAILRAHNQNVKAVADTCALPCNIVTEFRDPQGSGSTARVTLSGLSANCPAHLTSDVGHELATQSGTYGLLWYMGKDCKIKCSLRSNGDYDVSAIAKTFGGGGHKNAAGFEVDISTLLMWI